MTPPANVRSSLFGRPIAVESLETRRLLSGQWFNGEGPVVRRDARTVITADFNQDGYLDVVTPSAFGSGSSSMQVFVDLGDGAGGFESATYPGPTLSVTVSAGAAGDFNGDGLADLALARSSGISVFAGDGTGQFKALTSVAMSASGATSILVADLNADGRLDLVTPSSSGVVSVALGNGNATFATPVTYATGPAAAVAGGDFNGDGRLDLAVANATVNGTVSVLLGDGAGGFGTAVPFATGSRPMSLVTGDFNGDGKTDLATADFAGNSVSVLGGNGDGTFGPAVTTSVGNSPRSVAAADFDGDGRSDLVVANSASNTLSVLTQSAAGTLAVSATIASGVAPYAVVAADFNGDARPDLLTANNGEVVDSVFLNSGTGTFAPSVASTTVVGTKPMQAAAGDFDGDGRTDLVVANAGSNSVSYLAGQGNGTFAAAVSLPVGTSPYAVAAADFNGDGKLDVAAANYGSNTVSLLLGQGDGTFAAAVAVAVGTAPTSLTSADYNNDGRADLVVANSGVPPTSATPSLTVLLGTAAGGFVRSTIALGSTSQPFYVVTGDFNGDGKPDVAVSMRMGSNAAIATLLNTGSGFNGINASISLPGLIPSTFEYVPYQTVAVDLNGDGRDDLGVCLAADLYLTTLVSNPNGSFTTAYLGGMTANGALSLAAADLDADGTKEIIAASPLWPTGGAISLLKTERFLTPTRQATLAMDATAVAVAGSPNAVTAADFNGDGRPDVASVNADGTVAVLLNRYRANPSVTRVGDTLTVAAPGPKPTDVRVDVPTNSDLVRLTVDTPVGRETFWTNSLRHLVLSGANVVVKNDLRSLPGLQRVTVAEDAGVTFAVSQHLGTLAVRGNASLAAGGNKVLSVAGLDVADAGQLDLADNALLYDYAADAAQTAGVRSLIAAGRAGGTWTGPGLTSSAARNRIGGNTTLGLMTGGEYRALYGTAATFAGETVDDTAVLVQYTLVGDTNFDRRVDFNDFLRVQAAFGQTNTTSAGGDFDVDGDTDFDDFLALQTTFGQSLPAATPAAMAVKKSAPRVSGGK